MCYSNNNTIHFSYRCTEDLQIYSLNLPLKIHVTLSEPPKACVPLGLSYANRLLVGKALQESTKTIWRRRSRTIIQPFWLIAQTASFGGQGNLIKGCLILGQSLANMPTRKHPLSKESIGCCKHLFPRGNSCQIDIRNNSTGMSFILIIYLAYLVKMPGSVNN